MSPRKLPGTAGERFRSRFLADTDLDGPEDVAVLDQACELLDRIEQMKDQVAKDGLMVVGSTGNMRPHGLLAEIRQSQLAAAKLLALLRPGAPTRPASEGGRMMANARWRGRQSTKVRGQ